MEIDKLEYICKYKLVGKNGFFIAVGVIAIGAVGFFLFKGNKSNVNPSSPSNTSSQPSSNNTSGGVSENLTFTGAVNGKISTGKKGDTYLCSTMATGPIVGAIGGVNYTFEYRALNAKGPGTYKAFVQIGPAANKNLYYGGDSVSLTINSDGRSGSVEGDLSNLTNSSEKVHISGTYTCPPDY